MKAGNCARLVNYLMAKFCGVLSSGKLADNAAKALKSNISDAKAFQISDAKAPAAKAFRT